MGKSSKWKDARERRDGKGFVPVPFVVLNSRAYLGLSAHARMLLFDLLSQFNGSNNGTLACPFTQMRARGWKSEATLFKAKQELIASKLICETRLGARPNRVSYYAVTFYDLDEDSRLEMKRRTFPRGAWKLLEPAPFILKKPALENDSLTTPAVVEEDA